MDAVPGDGQNAEKKQEIPVDRFDRGESSYAAIMRAFNRSDHATALRRARALIAYQHKHRSRRWLLPAQVLEIASLRLLGELEDPVAAWKALRTEVLTLDDGQPPGPAERHGWQKAWRLLTQLQQAEKGEIRDAIRQVIAVIDHRPGERWVRRNGRCM